MAGSKKQRHSVKPVFQIRTFVTTVDQSGMDNVVLFPVNVEAGYLILNNRSTLGIFLHSGVPDYRTLLTGF